MLSSSARPRVRRSPRRIRSAGPTAALALGVSLTLAACSDAGSLATEGATTPPVASPAAASTTYPLTLDNCGFEVTFAGAPRQVVTIKSSTTEMMLALGLGDRIVGTAFPDGPVPDQWADAAAAVPAVVTPMADKVPGAEAVLTLEPDLVYAGWESNLTAEGAGDRATFQQLGVQTYVSPSACKDEAYKPDPLTFDDVFAEITEAGQIFDVAGTAADLVSAQRAELDALEPDDRGLTALWYSSGSDIPYVGAGIGAPQMIMDAVGVENIAASVQDTWTPFSFEEIIAADPDVIVLVDSAWNTAQSKIDALKANPATANLTAVQGDRFLTVPFPATEAGVRNVDAVKDLSAQLSALTIP
ncbi:vitamin B12-binding protein [Oerskovia enterophila]|uniref:Vitamin B12-binding protein n=1 Tax=Oerskovia enterophila TaxID=43678 RepID=A0A161XFP7_9CELL|nr:putative F420-0 ABC transporter substrate-binding protein [Oerskovia enterophila]KZM35587.1 vitamin B12-binding protein [Oerskovia enterophila]OCI31327.1 vitamin B12-binding protein [Oerskovia enterophila]